jgi:hypothetical protein
MLSKKLAIILGSIFLGVTVGAPVALADPPKKSCNSGGGNGSETDPASDCDPGNSGGHNNGKD